MASLLPLLHDLLPIFMPSKIQVTRSGDLVAVEERAELLPWYQQKPHEDAPMAESGPPKDRDVDCYVEVDDIEDSSLPGLTSGVLNPIQLLDHEEKRPASRSVPNEEEAVADLPNVSGEEPLVWSQSGGGPRVFRQNAMVGVSDKMCVTVLTVQPRSASAIHHHEIIIYATTAGVLLTSPALDPVKALRADIKGEQIASEEEQPRRFELSTGDFAFIPAWTEHQIVNEGSKRDMSWVLFHGGGEPLQVDLDGWGGGRIRR
ncbi:hypothetical protein N0V82_003108 [Gnomoniopsis sp. IMI 355080]|nr:hypothetical protein N0V82_003108 [Gnomoniopsis sp. IMI 355080]